MTDFGRRAAVAAANVLPKTGQLISYRSGDDGDYEKGWEGDRFTDNGDGTITDNATNLMWGKDANGPAGDGGAFTFWNTAIDYAEALDFAGHADWRLPNVYEFLSLLDASLTEWTFSVIIENADSKDFWTSTTRPDDNTAAIAWDHRNQRTYPSPKGGIIYLFCCRDA